MSKWQQRDFSAFDYKLILCFSITCFFSLPLSIVLSVNGKIITIAILVITGIFINLGIQHRIKHQWHWQGVKGRDLYKAIGITVISLFMLANISVSLFHGMNRSNGTTEFNWQPNNRFNPFETISEAIRIFPNFFSNPEHSIHFSFFCLMAISIIFNILIACKVVYLSEKEFLKDCKQPEIETSISKPSSNNLKSDNSLLAKLSAFFLSRPFIINKQQNKVKIIFNKVTTYDLKANWGIILFISLFFISAIYGLVMIVVFALPESLSNVENSQQQAAIIFTLSFQIFIFAFVALFIWNPWLRAVFVIAVIEFNPENIIVWERGFGSQRKILSISQSDLLPLQKKQVNTQVPQVRNTSLRIYYRRKNIELAGHLLPTAMDAVQDVYDRYRQNKFSDFYHHTQELYLE